MSKRIWIVLLALVLLAGGAAVGRAAYDRTRTAARPRGVVIASGRIEARTVRVGAGTGGRVLRLAVEEGDAVREGQLLADLDRRTQEALTAGALAAASAAAANVVATERHAAALESQLALAHKEAERAHRLYARDAAPRQAVDRADATLAQLEAELRAAHASRALAARQADAARAQARAASVQLDETSLRAPIAGTVEEELAREGEMVAPGTPLLVLRRTDETTVRVYLPIADAQRVHPGMEARAYVEAYPERLFGGVVERIASEAEFTPKDVHMPDDRATLVFAVDVRFPNLDGALKDGFPADVYIRWDRAAPWPARAPWR